MSYKKEVSKNSIEFEPLVRIIAETRKHKRYEISQIIEKEYGIIIGVYSHKQQLTPVDFGDERNYILFMLRWS